MSPTTQKPIVLAGREFLPVGAGTIAHDIEIMRLLKVAGVEDPRMLSGETPEAFGWRVLQGLIGTKVLLPMLACLIVPVSTAPRRQGFFRGLLEGLGIVRPTPEPEGWTPEVQAETAAFLGALDEPDDKRRVYQIVAETLFPFLRAGIASWAPSPRSSATAADPATHVAPGGPSPAPSLATGAS